MDHDSILGRIPREQAANRWQQLVYGSIQSSPSGMSIACYSLTSPVWTISAMNAFPVPFKITATVLLTAVLLLVGILNLRDRAEWVDPFDGVYWTDTASGLVASEITPGTPAALAGVRPGERLVSINGRTVSNLGQYFAVIDELGPNASATYELSGSESRTAPVQLGGKSLLAPRDALRTVLAFLHLGIGLFVVIRGVKLPRAFHFYLISVAAFVVYLYSYTPRLSALDWTVYGLSLASFLLLPALFIHFCLRFPIDTGSGMSRAPILYAPAVLLGVVQLLWMVGRLAGFGLPRTAESSMILDRIQLVYFCAGLIAGGAVLLTRRAAAREFATKQQMKWVSYGTLAGVIPFSLIYVVPWLFGVRPTFAMESSMLFLALIPLSFAYAVIRYRLLDVEVIIRRGAAYFIASTVLLAVYLAFVLIVGRGLQLVAPDANFVVICAAALVIALLFAPLRNQVQRRLDRSFYKDQFDDRASLLEFARTLSTEISLGRLTRSILDRVTKTFQVKRAAMFLADPLHPGFFRLADAIGLRIPETGDALYREDDLLDRGTGRNAPEADAFQRLHRVHPGLAGTGLQYAQDLNLRGRRIGIIALGQLPGDKHFSSEDIDLLSALSGYAAIALENANLYRSVETKAHELERLKIYTENIIESINVAVLAVDLDGNVTSCNRAFEELYHVRRDQVCGMAIEGLLARDVLDSIRNATGAAGWELKSSANIFKLFLENRRHEKLIVNLSVIPLLDPTDMNSGCLIVMDDITAKVRLEDQLMQVEKLSSIGLLAAGIAHEVNTPITGISSYTQMLLKQTPETDSRKPILEKIEKQTFRAAEIVNGLLNFARLNGSEFKDIDLNQLIRESLSLLDHQLRQGQVHVAQSLDEKIPLVYGNSGKLQQVFINLFLNARDAMNNGGELTVRTAMNDTMVMVDIQDTGAGISEEDIRKIYDPFFTTKSTGKGTGLGLAVTYGIVQEHGGRIFVDSTPGQGTHFKLKLPTRHAAQQ
jgi:two-component system, NtrC family, sensor kinase